MIFGNEIDIYRRKYGYNRAVETLDLMKIELINREIIEGDGFNYHFLVFNYETKSYNLIYHNTTKKTNICINLYSFMIYIKKLYFTDINYCYYLQFMKNKMHKHWNDYGQDPICHSEDYCFFNLINQVSVIYVYKLINCYNIEKVSIFIGNQVRPIENKEKKNEIIINEIFPIIKRSALGSIEIRYKKFDKTKKDKLKLDYEYISYDSYLNYFQLFKQLEYKNIDNHLIRYDGWNCYNASKYNNIIFNYINVPKSITIKETNEELEFPQEFIDIVIETDYENSRFYFDPDQYYRKQKCLDKINPKRKKEFIKNKYYKRKNKINKLKNNFKNYCYYYFNF